MRMLTDAEIDQVAGGTYSCCYCCCPPPPPTVTVHSNNGIGNGEEGVAPPGNSLSSPVGSKFGNSTTDVTYGR
jgi:hypothetical protein